MGRRPDPTEPVALYADGAPLTFNPSPDGGVYAWCLVDYSGRRVAHATGYAWAAGVEPEVPGALPGTPCISNNQIEFLALLAGLEALPPGFRGRVCSDSTVALDRFGWLYRRGRRQHFVPAYLPLVGIPREWQERAYAALRQHPNVTFEHVAGHPSALDLARHYREGARGRVKVSAHQVWCDREVRRLAQLWRDQHPERAEARRAERYQNTSESVTVTAGCPDPRAPRPCHPFHPPSP